MEPEYEAAARSLFEYGLPLAKVDATKEVELAQEFMIAGIIKRYFIVICIVFSFAFF